MPSAIGFCVPLKRKREPNFHVVIPFQPTAASTSAPQAKHHKFLDVDGENKHDEEEFATSKKPFLQEYDIDEDDDEDAAPEAITTLDSKLKTQLEQETAERGRQLQEQQLKQKRRTRDMRLKSRKAESFKTQETSTKEASLASTLANNSQLQSRSRLLPVSVLAGCSNRDESPSSPNSESLTKHHTLTPHTKTSAVANKQVHMNGPVYIKILQEDLLKKKVLAPSLNKDSKSVKEVWRLGRRKFEQVQPLRRGFLKS